jgi:nitrite reductase/ring-hydroxylating ferredoxin subunit
MTEDETWVDVGHVDDFNTTPLKRVTAMNRDLAVSLKDGKFGAVSNACNHVGGPLGDGRLDGDYIVCPWHNWRFHRCSGVGEPGFEEDRVPAYPMKVEGGRLFVNLGRR